MFHPIPRVVMYVALLKSLDAGFGQACNLHEPFWIRHCNVCQNLTVDLYICLFEAEDKLAVGQSIQA